MSYLVLARKYRPMVFGDLVAQQHVAVTLANAIAAGRISHAYLFSGPRGVGKTSTARILARAVNCPQPQGQDPCNKCGTCTEIIDGRSMDVLEIDGASNRGIDEIREIRDRVGYSPSKNKYKIFIIDEVHMLTPEAFNALLKTLEEPPSHVIFIFATTAPHKVPPTILSRCQRFDFKSVPTGEIVGRMERVLESEKIEVPPEVVGMIARKAGGAMRDALSMLDQVIAFCGDEFTQERAAQVLGVLDTELFFELTELILTRDSAQVVRFVNRMAEEGVDLGEFFQELAEHYRNLVTFKLGAARDTAVSVASSHVERYAALAERFETEDLIRSLQLVLNFENTFKYTAHQKICLELILLRLTLLDRSVNITDLLNRLESSPAYGLSTPGVSSFPQKPESGGKNPPGAENSPAGKAGHRSVVPEDLPLDNGSVPGSGDLRAENSPDSAQEPPGEKGPNGRVRAAGSGPVDLETIRRKWPQVIQLVKTKKVALAPVLSQARPEKYEDNVLVLQINRSLRFYHDKLKDPDCLGVIGEAIRTLFDLPELRLQVAATTEAEPVKVPETGQGASADSKSFEQFCRDNPVMGKLKELFDPDLIA